MAISIKDIPSVILVLVLGGIFLSLGLLLLTEFRTEIEESSTNAINESAYAGTNNTIAGLGEFGDWWDIIVLAIVAGIIISIVLGAIALRR